MRNITVDSVYSDVCRRSLDLRAVLRRFQRTGSGTEHTGQRGLRGAGMATSTYPRLWHDPPRRRGRLEHVVPKGLLRQVHAFALRRIYQQVWLGARRERPDDRRVDLPPCQRLAVDADHLADVAPGLQNSGAESCSAPGKITSSYFLLKWGVQIPYLFHVNQTPRSDSANFVPLEPIFCPRILEPRVAPLLSPARCRCS